MQNNLIIVYQLMFYGAYKQNKDLIKDGTIYDYGVFSEKEYAINRMNLNEEKRPIYNEKDDVYEVYDRDYIFQGYYVINKCVVDDISVFNIIVE